MDNSLPASWDPCSVDDGTPGIINSVFTTNVAPTCKDGARSIALPASSDPVTVTAIAFDLEGLNRVELFVDTGNGFSSLPMNDQGLNGDAVAGDSVYSAIIAPQSSGTVVKYYALATDDVGQQDAWPNNAPSDFHAYTVDYNPPKLRITELLAVNDRVNADEFGEYDDWFEIHNEDDISVNLGGMYVANTLGTSRAFQLPSLNLAPDEYLLVWADEDTAQGNLHVNFKLSSAGESVALFETIEHGNVLVHGWKYGRTSPDISMGFISKESTAPEYLATPTPGAGNTTSEVFSMVCINEFQATSDIGGPDDWIEIFNRGNSAYDLSGCFLSDERTNNTKWTFPDGTILNPGEYLVVFEDVLNFGFSSAGDDLIMFTDSDSTTGLDFYDFGPQIPDKSEGRFPDGASTWIFFDEPTRGEANTNISGIADSRHSTPSLFSLLQNYPNPFNPATLIRYNVAYTSMVELAIYNMHGRKVRTLVNQNQSPGTYSVQWDGIDDSGREVATGVYVYQLKAGGYKQVLRMLLVR